ncbi:hypothetical protein A2631_03655 [Candidatus Daviesbacteria bacterium RIFCSPHIGHO2_01_FULL_44_29]|uniref:UDP-N-acetylmuramate--L-alanine ligase n=1 Tax=Candidatus Daviesbacteria bacterium RIFCSPHIGHO2_02_FULL_43_12 TaxID=1797776 RepID=A0A1F5KI21_9BACT|nr:MAG: hypothetical protein A2631_03655 [Candidatus Daviesbacteria bacterium RIFCSPHIGHO2_01_FULL_44_29]OGE39829.1 MAG: hypothetical protein A3E86_04650 [Candidatus Daviesbacteria bacterium RIFCSPHIGHO2_12_FULL_47_45]OGE40455.1 MAG: hypothetical protein A3D25_00115 [Candidatus Daviesbacteria bacterium RIFCSPHIGHO2_02_FULL_43_12]OGE70007.1 MAG: hypothetical protein A3B55_04920 [Candidatus Daviesbacteria bacterium RIFCSPLOWO2_01_FULL_43_15]
MKSQRVHFLGIDGSGASAVASIAIADGFEVNGCGTTLHNEFTEYFDKSILISGEHKLKDVDILAVTPAIFSANPNHPDLLLAKKNGIKVMTWQEFMGEYLEKDKFVIAVCGTHGKSTTTAMVGRLLEDAGLDPTVELGAIVNRWGTNFRIGKGKYFVTEADEFNNNFLVSSPDITIVTTIEMDHPEFFKDLADYESSFFKFLIRTKQAIVANIADFGVAHVLKDVMKETSVTSVDYSKNQLNLDLIVPGKHNQQNASAVFQVGILLGIDPEIIRFSLENFTGVGRRFEMVGRYNGALVYSDFGHHPTEVSVTLEAAREKFPDKKITCIFQPHMYSRTRGLWKEFKTVLSNLPVDKTIVLDIYKARETPIKGVSSEKLVKEIAKKDVLYSTDENLVNLLKNTSQDDVLFFIGAGPVDEIARNLTRQTT